SRPPHDGNPSRGVAFSPDGRTLAVAIDPADVKLHDARTGREIRTLHGHTAAVWAVAFSPDGTRLASGGNDKTIRLWDTATALAPCPCAPGAPCSPRPAWRSAATAAGWPRPRAGTKSSSGT